MPGGHVRDGRADGRRYHWTVLAANEGDAYVGTFSMDPALRRRAAIELPMELYAPSEQDQREILEAQTSAVPAAAAEDRLELLLGLVDHALSLELTPEAALYLHYLRAMDRCLHSVTGRYQGPAFCDGPKVLCRLRQVGGGICQRVRGVSQGAWLKLARMARALALLRGARALAWAGNAGTGDDEDAVQRRADLSAWLRARRPGLEASAANFVRAYAQDLKVEDRDVRAALPLIGASKLGLDSDWALREPAFHGHEQFALRHVAGQTWSQLAEFRRSFSGVLGILQDGGHLSLAARKALMEHERTRDAWIIPALEAWSGRSIRLRDAAHV